VAAVGEVKTRAVIVQKKTGRPVQFEITEQTRASVKALTRIMERVLSTISEHLAHAYRCEICRIVYAFEDGRGMSLGRYPN